MEFEQTHHSFLPSRLLDDVGGRPPVGRVRCAHGVGDLGKMDAATLAKHAAAIVAKFEDSMEVLFGTPDDAQNRACSWASWLHAGGLKAPPSSKAGSELRV